MKKKKLGEVLRERGHISPINLAQAVAEKQGKAVLLGELLLQRGLVDKDQLTSALEVVTNIPYVNCATSSRQANRDAAQEMHAELLRRTTPAVKIVSDVIRAAHAKRASDIHIEPQADGVTLRIRVDGVLRDLHQVPRAMQNSLISRIKILADMDIAERRTPQDGRFMVRLGNSSIDMRVSTLPTQYGEKVVMRLLDSVMGIMNLSELSMPAKVESLLREILGLPQGMLLVTGPTGSGKSTTLYAALNLLRASAGNVVTVEDPVEYVLPGINQVHVNNKAGLTFSSCLRSILRQDPNVVMIGEIRDKETAEIALEAAQTGHLLLSSLHTNDSLSAVTRLRDLGIPAFMIASSVTGILAQRLVRRLCHCREQVAPSAAALERLAALGMTQPAEGLFAAVGCDDCDQTGYLGRVGVYEIVVFDEAMREAVRTGQNADSMRSLLRGSGFKLMQDDALDKIQQGITTVEEIARVVPVQTVQSWACARCNQRMVPTFRFCPFCGTEQPQASLPADPKSSKLGVEESLIL